MGRLLPVDFRVEPTAAEVEQLERAASAASPVLRPTKAPFSWAEDFMTVGVTGTNGKTSTTALVAAALGGGGHPVISETTIGYEFQGRPVRVPRTTTGLMRALCKAHQLGARHAALEVTSQALARGYAKLWRFDIGVFTNLSHDHLEQHQSFEHYLASKAQLFVHLGPAGAAILNACDPCSELLDRVIAPDVRRLWYGSPTRGPTLRTPDLFVHDIQLSPEGTRVELQDSALAAEFGGSLETRLVGDVFAENLLAAALASRAAGIDPNAIRRGLANCPIPSGRFQILCEGPLVATDYAHTPDALRRCLLTARALARGGKVLVVFGAGGDRDKQKRSSMGEAVGAVADVAIITNDNPRSESPEQIAESLAAGCRRSPSTDVRIVLDRAAAIRVALDSSTPDDCVVIAGKGHESTQEVAGRVIPFSDAEEVRRWLDELRPRR